MSLTISNAHLGLTFDPAAARWTLHPTGGETPFIEGARMSALLRSGGRLVDWQGGMRKPSVSRARRESRHGPLEVLRLDFACGLPGVQLAVEAALPRDHPFALIRLIISNQGRPPLAVEHVDLGQVGPAYRLGSSGSDQPFDFLRKFLSEQADKEPAGALRLHPLPGDLAFFVNGWQSWSFAGALGANQRRFHTRLGPVQQPQTVNPATPVPRGAGRFASDMFGVLSDRLHGHSLVAGFLSQADQFGSVEATCDRLTPSLRLRAQCDGVRLPPGAELTTEWAYIQFMENGSDDAGDPLRVYAEAVAREHVVRLPEGTPTGWCSWYHYFKSISESHVLGNLAALRDGRERLPLSLVQLDDGFEPAVGDWFETNGKFPHGLDWLGGEIKLAGFTPGLWLAPFILEQGAALAKAQPRWLLRNRLGLPVSAGWHWQKPSYALDLTHPGAQDHVRRLVETAVNEWGFPYLKLDFLYAAALPGLRHDATLTRAQTLRRALELIREAAGSETFLLGCGCPLGSGVGLFDAMRIGPDVDPSWKPQYRGRTGFLAPEPGMPSTRNVIRNTLTRAPLHRRWWLNDPDCLLLGEPSRLTLDETLSLATAIALSGGLLVLSDDMQTLSPDRRAIAEALLPTLGQAAAVCDWLDQTMPELLVLPLDGPAGCWKVIGLFNWQEAPAERCLNFAQIGLDAATPHHVSEFWGGLFNSPQPAYSLVTRELRATIPAHGVRLWAVRPALPGAPQFAGSTFHFSQGAEVKEWQSAETELRLTLDLGRVAQGSVWLHLPGEVVSAEVDGAPAVSEKQAGLWRIPLAVNRRASVCVSWAEVHG